MYEASKRRPERAGQSSLFDDLSFQIIHAIYLLERILQNFRTRSVNFGIVFFNVNRHLVLRAGESEFTIASRALARRLLYKHLQSLDLVNILTFASLSNENWINYRVQTKPMFAMVNDGGTLKEGVGGQFAAHQILAQRLFIFDLLASGLAMAPLQGADFRDTKIVFESKPRLGHQGHFPKAVLSAGVAARDVLATSLSFFDLQTLSPGSRGLIQFVFSSGQLCWRVTTIARNFAEANSPSIASTKKPLPYLWQG
ncbi:uncharacterized protein HD556DRAFT_1449516 [Suillus plorans]|uniref:ATP-dependent RNA helicase DDX60 PIN-like domain-containing protein n=1 Tax=Suillus plorans TaxID=116603 RepID=A0A9P7DC16_9AGAM|nr:uncharacterized protein HD556DRAFT_1449516 [Suillus plorans]KAG1786715.1 hypothetical protein HD556DRAFT_1449516 [Suillus plorans]